MKQYGSVLMLMARGTLYKMLALIILAAAAQAALFYSRFSANPDHSIEQLVQKSGVILVCGAAFLLLCALLSLAGCELRGAKMGYTIGRLSVGERASTLLWAGYNTACLLIFWAAQAAVMLALCAYYTAHADPAYVSEQTVFLAFYRSGFLHGLIPLEEGSRWLRNAVLLSALGLTSALVGFRQRRGKRAIGVIFLAALTLLWFPQRMGHFGTDLTVIFAALIIGGHALYAISTEDLYEQA